MDSRRVCYLIDLTTGLVGLVFRPLKIDKVIDVFVEVFCAGEADGI